VGRQEGARAFPLITQAKAPVVLKLWRLVGHRLDEVGLIERRRGEVSGAAQFFRIPKEKSYRPSLLKWFGFYALTFPVYAPAMPETYDVILAGLGAMGSAAAFHLAKRGHRVLGLDRFTPPHTLGSSHGQTRIIREAYFEHPIYVPMVQRAYTLWEELQRESGEELLVITGGLMIGQAESVVFAGARRSAVEHGLRHEVLSALEVRRRFPAMNPDDSMQAVWEPRAGILFPEKCVASHLELARRHAAELRFEEPVLSWESDGAGVRVTTARGQYTAAQLVISAGAWLRELAPELTGHFKVERQVLYWFEANEPEKFLPERCPIHLWQFDGKKFFYGFPDLGEGVKVAGHHDGEVTTAETVRREVSAEEVEAVRVWMRRFVPAANGPLKASSVCLYTNTADEHFWIDSLASCAAVLVVSPCSGHGFKFSSAIGEIVADRCEGREAKFDLSLFAARTPGEMQLPPGVKPVTS
jgi:sarcosine oxidase